MFQLYPNFIKLSDIYKQIKLLHGWQIKIFAYSEKLIIYKAFETRATYHQDSKTPEKKPFKIIWPLNSQTDFNLKTLKELSEYFDSEIEWAYICGKKVRIFTYKHLEDIEENTQF